MKLDLNFGPTNLYNKFWFWKYSPIFCLNSATIGVFFCHFLTFQDYFWSYCQVQNLFCYILIQKINFGFGSTALSFVFNTFILGASFALFWVLRGYLLGPLGLILGSRSGSKTFLEPTNVDYQFWFWKYSPIFCLKSAKIGAFLPFLTLQGYLWGWSQVRKLFSNISI